MTTPHLLLQCQHCHIWPAKYIIDDLLICPNCAALDEVYKIHWEYVQSTVSEADYFVAEYYDDDIAF